MLNSYYKDREHTHSDVSFRDVVSKARHHLRDKDHLNFIDVVQTESTPVGTVITLLARVYHNTTILL